MEEYNDFMNEFLDDLFQPTVSTSVEKYADFNWLPTIECERLTEAFDMVKLYGPFGWAIVKLYPYSGISEIDWENSSEMIREICNNLTKAHTINEYDWIFRNFNYISLHGWDNWVHEMKIQTFGYYYQK